MRRLNWFAPRIFPRPLAGLFATLALACGGPPGTSPALMEPSSELDAETAPEEVLSSRACREPSPGASPLRRLSNVEYRNTLVDLGIETERVEKLLSLLPSEPVSLGFRNSAGALIVNTLLVQNYRKIAEDLAAEFSGSCDVEQADCADQFISDLGLLLHRRPLSDQEHTDYRALFEKARDFEDAQGGARWVVTAMLQSPHFLYRVEIPGEQVEPVTGYEMASRLSFTFWQGPPDDELRWAAENGQLSTPEQITSQAIRLLQDERAYRVYEFFEQWLDLDELTELQRDPTYYPDLSPRLAQLMRAESKVFVSSLLSDPGASFRDLLSAKYTFANAELAEHYGLDEVEGDTFVRVEAEQRSGILTQGMLAVQDAAAHTSIVRRGLKLRTDFLCHIVPAPPDNVDLSLGGIDPELPQTERLALHSTDPSCAGCHSLMDPIGMAFDGVDAVGRIRTEDEHGNPLNTAGELSYTVDADGPIASPSDVAEALSSSWEAEQCYLLQNFRFFFGREARKDDVCSQAQLTQVFRDQDQSLVSVLVGLAQTDAFLYKAAHSQESE